MLAAHPLSHRVTTTWYSESAPLGWMPGKLHTCERSGTLSQPCQSSIVPASSAKPSVLRHLRRTSSTFQLFSA
eukprot:698047-Amphidinium_carterae.1